MLRQQRPDNLLGFLGARPRAIGESFRTNPRHGSKAHGRLAWQEGARPRVVPARFLDISRAGAALVTFVKPPEGTLVRVRLVGQAPTPWVEAEVLGVEPLTKGKQRVRLKFREPCPTVLLKTAVLGPVEVEAED